MICFKKRDSDKEWDARMDEKGMVGHPPYARWFCGAHYDSAKRLEHLTVDKAMEQLRK